MSLIQQSRLMFMTDFMSRKGIARQANISLYRLRLLEREGVSLRGAELSRLTSLSRNLAYSDLRIRGFNTRQARRFRDVSIDNLRLTHKRMENIQDYLSSGVYVQMKRSKDRLGIPYNEDDLWREAQEALFKGLQDSKSTIEEWENY